MATLTNDHLDTCSDYLLDVIKMYKVRDTHVHFPPPSPVRCVHVVRMYAVYRQAHTPTAVEFSVYCNFISSKEKNLVVAGTSQLFVYRIIHDVEVPCGMPYVRRQL